MISLGVFSGVFVAASNRIRTNYASIYDYELLKLEVQMFLGARW